jgi:hypothetical protein
MDLSTVKPQACPPPTLTEVNLAEAGGVGCCGRSVGGALSGVGVVSVGVMAQEMTPTTSTIVMSFNFFSSAFSV